MVLSGCPLKLVQGAGGGEWWIWGTRMIKFNVVIVAYKDTPKCPFYVQFQQLIAPELMLTGRWENVATNENFMLITVEEEEEVANSGCDRQRDWTLLVHLILILYSSVTTRSNVGIPCYSPPTHSYFSCISRYGCQWPRREEEKGISHIKRSA